MELRVTVADDAYAEMDAARQEGRPARLTLSVPAARREKHVTPTGPLAGLLVAGELRAGDVLYWERPRRGERHSAVVRPDGSLTFAGRLYRSPSGAARAAAGVQVDGWHAWRRERDGALLSSLRSRVAEPR
jgi:Restriction Enzyme Adenine Methylase Associated